MTIQHTVVFRLIHGPGSEGEESFFATASAVLAPIPGVGDFTISRQISPKSDLTYQFSMTFADEAAYLAYNEHPAHVGFVAEVWAREVAAFQEFDFVSR